MLDDVRILEDSMDLSFLSLFHSICFFSFPFQLIGNLNEDAKLGEGDRFFGVSLFFLN